MTDETVSGTQTFYVDDNWNYEQLMAAAEEVRKLMVALDEDINSIKTQIDLAKARVWTERKRYDPEWMARANSALRHKGRQRNSYQNTLGILNRRVRQMDKTSNIIASAAVQRHQDREFVMCAKHLLTGEQYQSIWDEVNRRTAGRNAP